MRIAYTLLSPTYGMHLYTADLARDLAAAGHDVHLITTATAPRRPYPPAVTVHTPVTTHGTGFAPEGARAAGLRAVLQTLTGLQPDLVHLTGVHLWNIPLLSALRRAGLPVVHTIHDLVPHRGVRMASLIRAWNRIVLAQADHILVHGSCYRDRLLAAGMAPERVSLLPLLHTFLGHPQAEHIQERRPPVTYEPWVLFFGRLMAYKGIPNLLLAVERLIWQEGRPPEVVLAGPGTLTEIWPGWLPQGVAVRNRLIEDAEGHDLFSRCSLLVLPYTGATQSALVAAAYAYGKPVIVSASGALPEYVREDRTGWVTPVGNVEALAARLQEALADPARLADMGHAGRRWYQEERSRQPERLQALYGHVLDTVPAAGAQRPAGALP